MIIKHTIRLSTLMGLLICCYCQVPGEAIEEQADQAGRTSILDLAKETYGEDFELHYNKDSTVAAICSLIRNNPASVINTLEVIMVSTADLETISKSTIANCTRHFWKGDQFIAIEVPGMVQSDRHGKKHEHILYSPK